MNLFRTATVPERHRFWEAAATIWSAATIALAASPLRNVNLITAPVSDKLLHALAFVFGALVWAGALPSSSGPLRSATLASGICLGLGGLIELLQTQTATRSAESGDLVADAVGIGIGILIWLLLHRGFASRADQSVSASQGNLDLTEVREMS